MANIIRVGGGIPEGDYVWEKYSLAGNDKDVLQSYVVSKNETKYPDDGILGNFWYKKIEAKVALPGQQIFTSSGTFTVPLGVTSVDVFLVGGGGGGGDNGGAGGGAGYTKTYKTSDSGYKDGDAISVVPTQEISIIVGSGGSGGGGGIPASNGGYSEFLNGTYRANGGNGGATGAGAGGSGGSGGGGGNGGGTNGGSDGANGTPNRAYAGGIGQGHTTKEFGELTGVLYAGAGGGGNGGAGGAGGGGNGGASGNGVGDNGVTNTGGGAGGGGTGFPNGGSGGTGGSGIVIVRWGGYSE